MKKDGPKPYSAKTKSPEMNTDILKGKSMVSTCFSFSPSAFAQTAGPCDRQLPTQRDAQLRKREVHGRKSH